MRARDLKTKQSSSGMGNEIYKLASKPLHQPTKYTHHDMSSPQNSPRPLRLSDSPDAEDHMAVTLKQMYHETTVIVHRHDDMNQIVAERLEIDTSVASTSEPG